MCGGAGREPCGQAASPTAAPPASLATLTVRAVGSEEGALGSFKVIALSPWDPGFPDSSSSLLRNLILGAGSPRDPGILFYLGLTQNSWAHLGAGPVPARGPDWIPIPSFSLPRSPIISPLGPELDNTISLPPLSQGLPAPKPPA